MAADSSFSHDLWTFLCGAKDRWKEIVGGSVLFIAAGVAASLGFNVPPIISGIAALCFAFSWACFLCWRDEHEKVRCKNLRSLLAKVTDSTKEISLYVGGHNVVTERVENIASLISISDELSSESDVQWICRELVKAGSTDPFELYEAFYPKSAFDGKRLKFLQDARVSEGRFIKTDTDAIGYIRTFWGPRNGMREIDHPIYPVTIRNGRVTWDHQMCKPRSAATVERLYLVPPQVLSSEGLQVRSTPPSVPNTLPPQETGNSLRSNRTKRTVPDPHGCIPGVATQQ